VQLTLMTPYYTGLKFYLELRDKLDTYKLIKDQPPYTPAAAPEELAPEYARAGGRASFPAPIISSMWKMPIMTAG
jgi:hypothetical protein